MLLLLLLQQIYSHCKINILNSTAHSECMSEVVKHLDLVKVWPGRGPPYISFGFPQQAGFDDILFAASYLQADNCCSFHGNNKLACFGKTLVM